MQLLSNLSSRLKSVESFHLRFNGRIFDIEREIRLILDSLSVGASTSATSSPQLADLTREVERLYSLLHSTLELIRVDITNSRDFVSSDLEGLCVSVREVLSQLDAIRIQL